MERKKTKVNAQIKIAVVASRSYDGYNASKGVTKMIDLETQIKIIEWAKKNEWEGGSTPDGIGICPICGMDAWGGHSAKNCWLKKLVDIKVSHDR